MNFKCFYYRAVIIRCTMFSILYGSIKILAHDIYFPVDDYNTVCIIT